MARSIEEGRKEGEVIQSINIAKKILIKKRSIEEIHEITELSIKAIEQLKAEIENLKNNYLHN